MICPFKVERINTAVQIWMRQPLDVKPAVVVSRLHVKPQRMPIVAKVFVVNIVKPCSDEHSHFRIPRFEVEVDFDALTKRVLETIKQELDAGTARELHNAAHHPEHGPVTYFQQVNRGGFTVIVGAPDNLRKTWFGTGSFVAFMDDEGPGHGSRVGPEGVQRTLRVLEGRIDV